MPSFSLYKEIFTLSVFDRVSIICFQQRGYRINMKNKEKEKCNICGKFDELGQYSSDVNEDTILEQSLKAPLEVRINNLYEKIKKIPDIQV